MFLSNNLLAINLFQYGETADLLTQYSIEFKPRENDESYTLLSYPATATKRLFSFNVSSLLLPSSQYTCVISKSAVVITTFNIRSSESVAKTYYESSIIDKTYED